ncbi:MAG: hypothetical protein DM484_16085 [Candidatus Methylumidiphilus alinenensis]|uniref:CopG family transcriptional regulator n=1 Tax=Candidatus Methylumidiphilus alinenensis TaxID=2202197 RepID=A0A2W4QXI0_9GAMM|nr:MAG: hypothetical protein DM484_16085 [Candidatus Methylumidiphilus alinenensis]
MTANFDLDKAKRHNLEQTQVKMDMPTWMVKSIDKEASRVSVHFPQGARASRPLKWRPRWPRSQEKAGGSERLPSRLGVSRQDIIKFWLSERLTQGRAQ